MKHECLVLEWLKLNFIFRLKRNGKWNMLDSPPIPPNTAWKFNFKFCKEKGKKNSHLLKNSRSWHIVSWVTIVNFLPPISLLSCQNKFNSKKNIIIPKRKFCQSTLCGIFQLFSYSRFYNSNLCGGKKEEEKLFALLIVVWKFCLLNLFFRWNSHEVQMVYKGNLSRR